MRGLDDRGERRSVDRRPAAPGEIRGIRPVRIRTVGVVHDLDVVGALGDPVGDKALRLLPHGDRRDAATELRAVAAGCGGQRPGGKDIGAVRRAGRALLPAALPDLLRVGEHVERGGDPEDHRLLEGFGRPAEVNVGLDESGQQGAASPVDDRRVGRDLGVGRDVHDPAVAHHDGRPFVHLAAVEEPDIAEGDPARGLCEHGRGRNEQSGDSQCAYGSDPAHRALVHCPFAGGAQAPPPCDNV